MRVRRTRGRPHRGEPAGAHPRQPADGAVQQVRLAGAHDRQQVRDVGRLHAPSTATSPAASPSSRTCRRRSSIACASGATRRRRCAERARRSAGAGRRRAPDPAVDHRARALGRAAPDQRDEDSLPPYELLDRILQGYVELDQSREQLIAAGSARARGRPHDPARRPRRVQAPPGAAGDQDHPARLRARPAHADHQPLPRLAAAWRSGRVNLPACRPRCRPYALSPRCARSPVRARALRLRRTPLQDQPIRTTSSRA